MDRVSLALGSPPQVASVGVGVHGVRSRHDVYRLPDLWQMHLYGYAGELELEGARHPIKPGHISLVPPGAEVTFRYQGRSEHLYAHFSLPGVSSARTVPVMQDAGAETPLLAGMLRAAIVAAPSRVRAEVWTVLWRVAHLSALDQAGQPHAAVAAAIAHIEVNLGQPLTVPDIARAARISHNHLTRLFREETGDTVVAYIRRRRMDKARHLLRESTMAVAAIAAEVGIPDLQAFNKACRRELGAAPRTVRMASSVR